MVFNTGAEPPPQTRQENQMNTMTAVTEAHQTLARLQARTGGDWARNGYSIQAAQAAVDAAEAQYRAAFAAHVTATC